MPSTLDHAVETIIRESDRALFGTASYDRLLEKWSDAARAAALAARRARAKGGDWRKAAAWEYVKKGGSASTRQQLKTELLKRHPERVARGMPFEQSVKRLDRYVDRKIRRVDPVVHKAKRGTRKYRLLGKYASRTRSAGTTTWG